MSVPATAGEYRAMRAEIGNQKRVAELLGSHPITLTKREGARTPLHHENALALAFVWLCHKTGGAA